MANFITLSSVKYFARLLASGLPTLMTCFLWTLRRTEWNYLQSPALSSFLAMRLGKARETSSRRDFFIGT